MTERTAQATSPAGRLTLARCRLSGLVVFAAVLAFSTPSRPKEATARTNKSATGALPARVRLIGGLEVGLASPPVVGADGGWWLLGRDGEVERFGADDSLKWSISIAASIKGPAATNDAGQLVFIPTSQDHVVALDRDARVHWKYRTMAGIVGAVCWVPKQGLAFMGRDGLLYWLDTHATLVLRAAVKGRVTAGPVAFGSRVLVGTEDGQIVALSRQGTRKSTTVEGKIRAIAVAGDNATVLAGHTAYVIDSTLTVRGTTPSTLSIGVAASRGHESRTDFASLAESGELRWLEPQGTSMVLQSVQIIPFALQFVATSAMAWLPDDSGKLWQVRRGGSWESLQLGHAPLLCPILDLPRQRILVGSEAGSVWSLSIDPLP